MTISALLEISSMTSSAETLVVPSILSGTLAFSARAGDASATSQVVIKKSKTLIKIRVNQPSWLRA
jgi:hypothetical protein